MHAPRGMWTLGLLVGLSLAACQPADPDWANKAAMRIGKPDAKEAELRQRQTTSIDNATEQAVLIEATQVLQDLGFNVEESAARYGVLAGSKERDATETGQVVGQVAVTIALAVLGVQYNPVWDTDQVVRVTVTTRPANKREVAMRVSFERIITDTNHRSRVEVLPQPEFAQGFFEKVRTGLGRGRAQ